MYGRPFVQDYGWYIQQRRFEIGVFLASVDYLRCPREIRVLLEIDPNAYHKIHQELLQRDPKAAARLQEQFHCQERQVARAIEDEVRARFGYKPVGSPSSGEATLYRIIRRLFPNEPIHRCSRPSFLEGMEFDIFLPRRRVAVEFQGEQHFRAIEHWGGQDALAELQTRDQRKRDICCRLRITLVHFDDNDALTESLVSERIRQVNRSTLPSD